MTGVRTRIATATTILSLLVGLAACTGDGGLPRPAQLVRNAAAAARATSSAHIDLRVSGAPLPGVSLRGMSADVTRDRAGAARAQGELVVPTVLGATHVAFVEVDSVVYTKDQTGHFVPAPQQNGTSNPLPTSFIDPDRGVANLLTSMRSVRTEAKETIANTEAFRVTGTIAAADIAKLAPSVTQDGTLTVWFKVGGRHEPVATRMVIGSQDPATQSVLDVGLGAVDRPVEVPDPR